MRTDRIIICSMGAGLDDMRRKDQSCPIKVLRVLKASGRFSVFEATANIKIARLIQRLYHCELVFNGKSFGGPMLAHDDSLGFPWTKVVLTNAGQTLLANPPRT